LHKVDFRKDEALTLKNLPLRVDEYDLRARLFPGMIVTLPLFVGAFALWPALRKPTGLGLGAVVEAALLFWIMRIARDRGKRIEVDLFLKWGGRPTTLLLRWRNEEIDPITKLRYHQMLAKLISTPFPSANLEQHDPDSADVVYESGVRGLLEKRRSKTYRLIFEENCNYGFARNLYGLRAIGMFVYVAVGLALGASAVINHGRMTELQWALVVIDLICLGFLMYVTEASVKRAAYAYGVALLRSCDVTPTQRRASKEKN